jgi:hypothetical protein
MYIDAHNGRKAPGMARALPHPPECPLFFVHPSDPRAIMHYEDEARRFNLLSGFLFGAMVGAGVGLMAGPVRRMELPHRKRSRRERLAKRLDSVRHDAEKAAKSAIESGTRRLRR